MSLCFAGAGFTLVKPFSYSHREPLPSSPTVGVILYFDLLEHGGRGGVDFFGACLHPALVRIVSAPSTGAGKQRC